MKANRFLPFLILLAAACGKTGLSPDIPEEKDDYSDILIPESRVPLYADIADYNLIPGAGTRSSDVNVSLESLIDRSRFRTCESKGQLFTQIAFRANEDGDDLACSGKTDFLTEKSWVPIKKFLVYNKKNGQVCKYVVTMVPGEQYHRYHPDYDFFEKPNFTGSILYSTLEGRLFLVQTQTGGKIQTARVYSQDEVRSEDTSDCTFLYIYRPDASTRGVPPPPPPPGRGGDDDDDGSEFGGTGGGSGKGKTGTGSINGGVITGSICTATTSSNPNWYDAWKQGNLYNPGGEIPTGNSTGNTGNEDYTTGRGGTGSNWDEQPNTVDFNISAIDTYTGKGILTLGSGRYNKGDIVNIDCGVQDWPNGNVFVYIDDRDSETDPMEFPIDGFMTYFNGWLGDFHGITTYSFQTKATKDINSVAIFGPNMPCIGTKNGRTVVNPLDEMRVAPTSKNANYASGTFDVWRYPRSIPSGYQHKSIDFIAEPGTPVYAIKDGYIAYIKKDANYYKDRKTNGKASGGYGNIITIACPIVENGKEKTIYFQYSHLQYGNCVANNPRDRGLPFFVGSRIYAGEIIGYTGYSGNAAMDAVVNKHLDIGAGFTMGSNGIIPKESRIDPLPYLNGTYDKKTLDQNEGKLQNVKCD